MKLHNFTTPREREIISWRKFHLSTHYIIFNWISRFDLGFLSSRDRERKIAEFFMIFHGSERKQKKTFRDLWYWSYFINVFLASFSHRKINYFLNSFFLFVVFPYVNYAWSTLFSRNANDTTWQNDVWIL